MAQAETLLNLERRGSRTASKYTKGGQYHDCQAQFTPVQNHPTAGGLSKLAIAAWKALDDRELFEIEGKLVFTDDLEAYLEDSIGTACCCDVFDSHAAFERWLLNCVADWIKEDPTTISDLDEYINLA